jgi:hypothetical protein
LYTLTPAGESRWRPTPLVEQYRGYIDNPRQAIGNLVLSHLPNPKGIGLAPHLSTQ